MVYRRTVRKATPILVSATIIGPTRTRDASWVIKPTTPFITRVSQKLRSEGLPVYYKENTFYLTDSMFRPGAIAAWVRIAGDTLYNIRSVRVSHSHPNSLSSSWNPFGTEISNPTGQGFQTEFNLEMQADGTVMASDVSVVPYGLPI